MQRQPLLVRNKQQVNPLFSMHNYNPLVINENDKNKQLTLLPTKLAFLGIKMSMALQIRRDI
jgi:hypothetical protein